MKTHRILAAAAFAGAIGLLVSEAQANSHEPAYAQYCARNHPGSRPFVYEPEKYCVQNPRDPRNRWHRIDLASACRLTGSPGTYVYHGSLKVVCTAGRQPVEKRVNGAQLTQFCRSEFRAPEWASDRQMGLHCYTRNASRPNDAKYFTKYKIYGQVVCQRVYGTSRFRQDGWADIVCLL